MSLTIDALSANYDHVSDIPKVVALQYGFPSDDLLALYLFQEGVLEAAHTGPFLDASGNSNHAPLKAGWPQPANKSFGVEFPGGGACILPPVPVGTRFTVTLVVSMDEPNPSAQRFPFVLSRAVNAPLLPTDGTPGAAPQTVLTAEINPSGLSDWGIFNSGGLPAGGPSRIALGAASQGQVNDVAVLGLTYDTTTGDLIVKRYGGGRVGVTQLGLFLATDRLAIGVMPYLAGQTPDSGAQVLLYSQHGESSEELLDQCIESAVDVLFARGVFA